MIEMLNFLEGVRPVTPGVKLYFVGVAIWKSGLKSDDDAVA